MTYEEIENVINGLCEDRQFDIGCFYKCETDGRDCFVKIAKKALEKKNKYRWHDLINNPNDLPFDGDDNLLVSIDFRGTEMWMVCLYEEDEFRDGINPPELFQETIKAWKYIEPFEEVDE